MSFHIKQITCYNYTPTNKELNGTIEMVHDTSHMELKIKMNAEDVARIFEIFADRVAVTMREASQCVLEDVIAVPQIEKPSGGVPAAWDTDEIPF